ncbi:uncharacterized protein LOC111033225 [Myzus persicae]|uniref:uncharacterized protein LOC111033225 n=1 Tax=Myzus persicae TaxID=13164 RepID=UPI000B932977|nr:uncharacterized protein LOC111033225 [Myzus persicae]XP_022169562.1 uncharacterized protein LOC111033225 [Myzus persicae]XP_022169563.1 uncharacterized protein LOC111033225 [Myzus persicae]
MCTKTWRKLLHAFKNHSGATKFSRHKEENINRAALFAISQNQKNGHSGRKNSKRINRRKPFFFSRSGEIKNNVARPMFSPFQRENLVRPVRRETLFGILHTYCETTTATPERSFSTLKRLKTYPRSTTNEDRLNGLALMSVHRDIPIDVDAIFDEMALTPRKLDFVL